jgi:hypothetical protein
METNRTVNLVRYWNYIFSPFVVLLSFFTVYVLTGLKPIQTMNSRQVADGMDRIRGNIKSSY